MSRQVDRLISPLAHGRLTPEGSTFELWDLFVRFRSYVWTGQTDKWQASGQRLYELLELRERTDTSGLAQRARQTRYRLSDALQYLETNIQPKSGSYPVAGNAFGGLKCPIVGAILSLT